MASRANLTVQAARVAVAAEPRIDLLLRKVFAGESIATSQPKSSEQPQPRSLTATQVTVVGIDIGGTNIRGALVCGVSGKILSEVVKRKVINRSPEGFMKLLGEVYDEVVTSNNNFTVPVAIGVGQPGFIDDAGCLSKMANYPEWGDNTSVPVKAFLQQRSGCSNVVLFNDADTLLAAEVWYGAGRLASSVAMITVGTGIGTAMYSSQLSQQLYKGTRGLVEGGHSIVDSSVDAPTCGCGQRGCLEVSGFCY